MWCINKYIEYIKDKLYCIMYCNTDTNIYIENIVYNFNENQLINYLKYKYSNNCNKCFNIIFNNIKNKLCCMLYYSNEIFNNDIISLNKLNILNETIIKNYLKNKNMCESCNIKKFNLIKNKLYCKIHCYMISEKDMSEDIKYFNNIKSLNDNIIINYYKNKYPYNCYICTNKILNILSEKLCCMLYYSNEIFNNDIIYLNKLDKLNETIIINYLKKKNMCESCNKLIFNLIKNKIISIDKNDKKYKDIEINSETSIDKIDNIKINKNHKENISIEGKIDNKPIFKYNSNYIKAGGVLFYRIYNNNKEFLVIEENNKYSDLGGKIEEYDKTIYDTISREVYEESNKYFEKDKIYNILIQNKNERIYIKNAKYLLYILNINLIDDNIITSNIKWISRELLIEKHHPRLRDIINDI